MKFTAVGVRNDKLFFAHAITDETVPEKVVGLILEGLEDNGKGGGTIYALFVGRLENLIDCGMALEPKEDLK